MAEMNSGASGGRRRPGARRSKKLSTRVDLTPMVDLGFLLITFFIFSTTMSESKAMKMLLPANAAPKDMTPLRESGVITLIPVFGDSVYYYEGMNPGNGIFIGEKEARSVIMRKKQSTNPANFVVVLKPAASCTYKNIVHLLDEMLICDVRNYVMADAEKTELLAMRTK